MHLSMKGAGIKAVKTVQKLKLEKMHWYCNYQFPNKIIHSELGGQLNTRLFKHRYSPIPLIAMSSFKKVSLK